MFHRNFYFSPKFLFFTIIWIFDQNFNFWPTILLSDQHFTFRPFLDKNVEFWPKPSLFVGIRPYSIFKLRHYQFIFGQLVAPLCNISKNRPKAGRRARRFFSNFFLSKTVNNFKFYFLGLKNVFDEAILAALEPPDPNKGRKRNRKICKLL